MIFPKDINKKIVEQHKIAGDNKIQLTITVMVLGNIILWMLVSWLVRTFMGGSLLFTIFAMVVINIFVGIFAFRYFIFDEASKVQEYKASESDSFARFMKVRKDLNHTIKVNNKVVNATEFGNGSLAFTMVFKFGSNDDVLAKNTEDMFSEMFRVAHHSGFETRTCVLTEEFEQSIEFRRYSQSVNRIKRVTLKNALTLMLGAIMKENKKKSNTDCIYFTVRSLTNYQRADLEDILKNYLKIIRNYTSAFREIKFLDNDELMQFFTIFYGVGAIDLSTTQAIEIANEVETQYKDMLEVYSLHTTDNTVYKASDIEEKIFRLKERNID